MKKQIIALAGFCLLGTAPATRATFMYKYEVDRMIDDGRIHGTIETDTLGPLTPANITGYDLLVTVYTDSGTIRSAEGGIVNSFAGVTATEEGLFADLPNTLIEMWGSPKTGWDLHGSVPRELIMGAAGFARYAPPPDPAPGSPLLLAVRATPVPDSGSTLVVLGVVLVAAGWWYRCA